MQHSGLPVNLIAYGGWYTYVEMNEAVKYANNDHTVELIVFSYVQFVDFMRDNLTCYILTSVNTIQSVCEECTGITGQF